MPAGRAAYTTLRGVQIVTVWTAPPGGVALDLKGIHLKTCTLLFACCEHRTHSCLNHNYLEKLLFIYSNWNQSAWVQVPGAVGKHTSLGHSFLPALWE